MGGKKRKVVIAVYSSSDKRFSGVVGVHKYDTMTMQAIDTHSLRGATKLTAEVWPPPVDTDPIIQTQFGKDGNSVAHTLAILA